jgi:chromosome segregation ATPase
MNWKLTIFLIATITLTSCYIVYDKQHRKVKALQLELDMNRAELGTYKDRAHDEREDNNKFGNMVRELRDSIDLLENLNYEKNQQIAELQKQKNEILRKDYSKHTDSDLSTMLLQLFAEQDSMP